jgi:hypothetical protein
MIIRAAVLLCVITVVMPLFSNDPNPDLANPPEFYFTRLIYTDIYGRGSGGGGLPSFRGFGRGGAWMTDAWDADNKYMWGIDRMTNVKLSRDPHPMGILDPDLFKFPYIYAVEVGQMELSTQEAARLREYLLRGGFWHVDDFWGLQQFAQFQRQMKKVFPDRAMEELPLTHEIFHTFFDIDGVLQVPNVRYGEAFTQSGGRTPTWEQRSDTNPRVFGISDDYGRLMVLITYNSDLGDAWEWMDDPEYPALFTGYAYRVGMNSIVYAMSH